MCLFYCSRHNLKYLTEKVIEGGQDGGKLISVYKCSKCSKEHLITESR
jgi:hypothetical protein